jgi:Ca-activated chloride channel family protein
MTVSITSLPGEAPSMPDAGLGTLRTADGNLPLDAVDVHAAIIGLAARVEVTQEYRNPFDVPLEATYIFPLPDRAAVTGLRMEAADRVIEGVLKERGQARQDYDAALAAGQRAAIAEEDRPDVFTMRVGNILPAERVTVRLTLDQPLPYEDGAARFRFPLVVAPRYIPGAPLDEAGPAAGSGVEPDTDAVPDASRISPPVLLPGFPNPVRLSLTVDVDPGGLPLTEIGSALHVVTTSDSGGDGGSGRSTVRLEPGERLNRDFVLRLGFAPDESSGLTLTPDEDGADAAERTEGTFNLVVLPTGEVRSRPRDVVLVMDRSGSMGGWKIVAARRAAGRIVDTLTGDDRFAVLSFDHSVDTPRDLPPGLVPGTDRNRFRAVEHLAGLGSRGGTEMLTPLRRAAALLTDAARDRVLVLITDGQVGNEDQILRSLEPALIGVRVHTVGIDRAVNAGFLNRLAAIGAGRAEFVESEDRLDEAMEYIHHRIAAPLVTGLSLSAEGLDLVPDTVSPSRLGALFPGVPLVVGGRWRGRPDGSIVLRGVRPDGTAWRRRTAGSVAGNPAATAVWARAHLRELEDRYVVHGSPDLEKRIVDTSLRFGVLCRFTAFVAVDTQVATSGELPHQVIQPVELPDGWVMPPAPTTMAAMSVGSFRAAAAAARPSTSDAAVSEQAATSEQAAMPAQPAAPMVADPSAVVRRRLAKQLGLLRQTAREEESERRRRLTEFRDLLDSMLAELRAARVDAGRFAALSDLLTELTAWVDSGDPSAAVWDRTIRTLAAFAEGPQFWKQRP